jgi:hypothetical protein
MLPLKKGIPNPMCKDNPEKVMIVFFPLITLGLFAAAVVLWWVITTQILH